MSSNGSAEAKRKRARPRGPAGPLEGGAEGAPAESPAEASGEQRPGPTPKASAPASSQEPSEQGAAPARQGPAEERVEPTSVEPPPQLAAPGPSEEPTERGRARAPDTPASGKVSASPGTEHESRTHEPEPVVDRQHVRVHLFDGRVIEGYKRGHYSQENRVLVLDVETVFDANGKEVPRTPLDSFLLPPQIDRIEPFDEASDAPGAGARDVRRGGKLPAS